MSGRGDKRRAILDGALAVFAREGYTRAAVDAIAAEAGVSTRTIYNHFADKAALFQAVVEESSTRVAEAQTAVIDRHLRKVVDLEDDLVEFGLDWTAPMTGHEAHTALVRRINAEAGHVPPDVIEAWQEKGPRRVIRALADHLRRLADRGLLEFDDPERAALQLMLLVGVTNWSYRAAPRTDAEVEATVRAGVRTFLHGNLLRS
ncbi:TetR/AcrR family transcriptional regulator [Actinomadura kijaniata]|uniref:AcrR family transcriptional regulator n=1 Tax=Actinomadura namibiensis TaxID=182080 RepID=A0A7W3LMQ1_ACTNM|nr:TetR/AcrR family transcriptional regulator [Actinomadura namibiensis]MBA8950976.1 AcrR family transcriptional regulator [Actinomadura namibiensis]